VNILEFMSGSPFLTIGILVILYFMVADAIWLWRRK